LDEPVIRRYDLDGDSTTLQLRWNPLIERFEFNVDLQGVSTAVHGPAAQGPTVPGVHLPLPTLEGLQDAWGDFRVLLRQEGTGALQILP
jgi:hypothetical protein